MFTYLERVHGIFDLSGASIVQPRFDRSRWSFVVPYFFLFIVNFICHKQIDSKLIGTRINQTV